MSSGTLYRSSGVALLVGALLAIIGNVLSSVLFPGNDPHQYVSALWLPVMLLSFVGSLLLLIGLPAISARQATRAGWLGLIGFVLTFIGGVFFIRFFFFFFLFLPLVFSRSGLVVCRDLRPATVVFFLSARLLFFVWVCVSVLLD